MGTSKGVRIVPDLADLQETVRILNHIEDIKKLKAKYLRCIDGKLWDELSEVFREEFERDTSLVQQQY